MRPEYRPLSRTAPSLLRKAVRAGGIFAFLPAMLLLVLSCGQQQQQAAQQAVPVLAEQVASATVPLEVRSIGTVEAYQTVEIKARVGGELVEVFFEEGDHVERGEALFRIDPAPYRAALEEARAALERDSVRAWNAGQTVRRYSELIEKDYITRQQYDQMLSDEASLRATVRADRAAVEKAVLDLGYTLIRSPISGRTGRLLVHEGNIVRTGGDDAALVVIHQIEPVYVDFTVPERHLPEIQRQSASGELRVRAMLAGTDAGPMPGRLAFIDNAVDERTGTVALKAEFENSRQLLWPGRFANVVLVLREVEDAVVAPSEAIQSSQEGRFVYVVKPDSTVESRRVEVSFEYDNTSVIASGVEPGETVVTDGQLRLRPGSLVTIRRQIGAAEAGER